MPKKNDAQTLVLALASVLLLFLAGCSSSPKTEERQINDPSETTSVRYPRVFSVEDFNMHKNVSRQTDKKPTFTPSEIKKTPKEVPEITLNELNEGLTNPSSPLGEEDG